MALWFPALFHASKLHSPDICKDLKTIMEGGPDASLRCQCWGIGMEITVDFPRPQACQGDKSFQGAPSSITMPQPKRLRGCRKLGIRCTKGGHRVPGSLKWQRGKPSQHSQQEPAAEKKRKRKKVSESQAVLFLFAKLILQLSP